MDGLSIAEQSKNCLPICVPSYHRYSLKDNKTMKMLLEAGDKEITNNCYIFVRSEEYARYKKISNDFNYIKLPDVKGLSDTRQYIVDFVCDVLHQDLFIDADDDLTGLTFTEIKNGRPKVSKSDTAKILRGISSVGEYLAYYCDVALAGVRKRRFANNKEFVITAAKINSGNTPRQLMVVNAKKLRGHNIVRNEIFNPTGDDVGFVAEIAKNTLNFASICCFQYSYVDDKINSVIRNDENRKSLAAYEYECLKKYPMGKYYLRIPHTFEDGSYMFSDIDYKKYKKVTGLPSFNVSVSEVLDWLTK